MSGILVQSEYIYRPAPLHICSVGRFNSFSNFAILGTNNVFNAFNWGTINLARYAPMSIPFRFTVARFMSANFNATGNTDIGLYDANGNRLLSTGTTARAGVSAMQYIDVTDTSFPAGMYYLAMVCSSATSQVPATSVSGSTSDIRMAGMLQEALGSTVLPVTMTPVAFTASGSCPIWGFTQSGSL